MLEFDSATDTFRISLRSLPDSVDLDSRNRNVTARHLRFAYAHELAHRFLYVQTQGTWRRALAIVADEYDGVDRMAAIRQMSALEETICSDAASRILLPDAIVVPAIGHFEPSDDEGDDPGDIERVWRLIGYVADRFNVSWWCALRRMAKLRQSDMLPSIGDDFCFLLIGASAEKGSAGRGRLQLRVMDYSWPSNLCEAKVKPLFPGFPCAKLGEELAARLNECFESGASRAGHLSCSIMVKLSDKGSESIRSFHLEGRWKLWTNKPGRQVAVYGRFCGR